MKMVLPSDVADEILVRLPVKSLMRFKCVDQCWNDLFTTPSFITKNTHHMKKERMMISEFFEGPRLLISANNYEELGCPPFPDNQLTRFKVCGDSHNGVFCIKGEYHRYGGSPIQLYLWNPSTRDLKLVPPPPSRHPSIEEERSHYPHSPICGFGGDPDTYQFNLINIVPYSQQLFNEAQELYDKYTNCKVELYSLATNSWTTTTLTLMDDDDDDDWLPVKLVFTLPGYGTLANGVCHWFCDHHDDECIICFDFRNNQFRRLDLPPQPYKHHSNNSLFEVNHSIAYVHQQFLQAWTVEIWIFEQDGCCWTKKYMFELDGPAIIFNFWKDPPEFLAPSRYKIPFRVTDDEEPVYLASFKSDGQLVRHFEQVNLDEDENLRICKYVESIAPLSFF